MEIEGKMKELNITEDNSNENIIGRVKDIKSLFLFMIKKDIDDTYLDIEEVLANIDMYTELIKEIYKSGYFDDEKIIVSFNPMGKYNFEKYEEVL